METAIREGYTDELCSKYGSTGSNCELFIHPITLFIVVHIADICAASREPLETIDHAFSVVGINNTNQCFEIETATENLLTRCSVRSELKSSTRNSHLANTLKSSPICCPGFGSTEAT